MAKNKTSVNTVQDPRVGNNDLTDSQNDTSAVESLGTGDSPSLNSEISIPDRVIRKGKQSGVEEHRHNGQDLERIDVKDFGGFIEVVPSAPAHTPKNFFDQIKIFDNAGTPELHVYDYVAKAWRVFT